MSEISVRRSALSEIASTLGSLDSTAGELRGAVHGDHATTGACGDASLSAAFSSFQSALSQQLSAVQTEASHLQKSVWVALSVYTQADGSVMGGPGAPNYLTPNTSGAGPNTNLSNIGPVTTPYSTNP